MPDQPRTVLIDGVRYVPATDASVDAEAIMRALALTYTTPEMLAEHGDADYRYLRVMVGEPEPDWEAPTIEEFVADLIASRPTVEQEQQ